MSRLGRWCFGHRKWVVAGWLVVLVVIAGLSVSAGSRYNSSLSLPGTDSQAAVNLLTKNFLPHLGRVIRWSSRPPAAPPSVRLRSSGR